MDEMERLLDLLSGDTNSSLNTATSYCLALGYLYHLSFFLLFLF